MRPGGCLVVFRTGKSACSVGYSGQQTAVFASPLLALFAGKVNQ